MAIWLNCHFSVKMWHFHIVPPFLLMGFLLHSISAVDFPVTDHCLSCASSILRSQWQATGLPQIPHETMANSDKTGPGERKQFMFTDTNCLKPIDVSSSPVELPLSSCTGGYCFEMFLAINGRFAAVRGCLSDFFPSGQAIPMGEEGCNYGKTQFQNITTDETDLQVIPQPSIGINLCKAGSLPLGRQNDRNTKLEPCNSVLKGTADWARGSNWPNECKQSSAVQCLNCQRYDGEGNCHRDMREYCDGAWCTKTIGYVNGRWLEIRGCAPFSPLNVQMCTKQQRQSELSQLNNNQIPLWMSLEQCFCKNQYCNGAGMARLLGGRGAAALPLTLLFSAIGLALWPKIAGI